MEIPAGGLDVLDGSPPCQGFSLSGRRQLDDDRNQLFRQYVRLIDTWTPAVPAEFLTGLDALAGDTDTDAALADPATQIGVVIGLVRVELVRFAAAPPAPRLDRGDGQDQRLER